MTDICMSNIFYPALVNWQSSVVALHRMMIRKYGVGHECTLIINQDHSVLKHIVFCLYYMFSQHSLFLQNSVSITLVFLCILLNSSINVDVLVSDCFFPVNPKMIICQ